MVAELEAKFQLESNLQLASRNVSQISADIQKFSGIIKDFSKSQTSSSSALTKQVTGIGHALVANQISNQSVFDRVAMRYQLCRIKDKQIASLICEHSWTPLIIMRDAFGGADLDSACTFSAKE